MTIYLGFAISQDWGSLAINLGNTHIASGGVQFLWVNPRLWNGSGCRMCRESALFLLGLPGIFLGYRGRGWGFEGFSSIGMVIYGTEPFLEFWKIYSLKGSLY